MIFCTTLVAQVAEQTITTDTTIADSRAYSGEGFVAVTPNSTALHRNAVVVYNGATLTLGAGASLWVKNDNNNTTFLRVGYPNATGLLNGTGTLLIGAGADLRVGQDSRYANFLVGEGAGNTGVVQQAGGNVKVQGSFNLGVDGGTGTYTLTDGVFTLDHDNNPANKTSLATLGLNLNAAGPSAGTSNGQLIINGGRFDVLAHQWDSSGHPGEYGSVELILGNRDRGAASYGDGNGTITQNGGVLHIDNHASLNLSSVGNGIYDLNGGTLEIGGASLKEKYGNGAGTYLFTLGGGTIKIIGSALDTSVNAALKPNTLSTFDADDFSATWRGALTGSGSLTKTGTKTLTLTNAANAFGVLDVKGGGVSVTAGSTTLTTLLAGATGTGSSGAFSLSGGVVSTTSSASADLRTSYIGAGAGNTGSLILAGGTLNIGLAATPAVRADFEVGSFNAHGSATQTGGSLTLNSTGGYFHIGNQGTGVYDLQNGSITMQNAMVLGRSTSSGLGDGTLTVSGGTLTLASTSKGALILGGVDAANTVTGGKGTVNQTGGTVSVGQYLELGTKGGTGIYNLNGGTLQIGGAGGIKRDASGTYEFNFGGGALKVAGSDLTTSINANVLAGKTSAIDTAGLNATWSGNLISAGLHQIDFGGSALFKIGAGNLTFNGATRTLDTFAVLTGTVTQTAGATSAVEFMTGSGAGSSATYVMNGGTLTINTSTRADNVTLIPGTMRVGDFGGTGTFTQNAGTITVGANGASALNIGNQGGSGVFNLAGGTLILTSGNNVIARSGANYAASSGSLNISGGTLQLQPSSALIIGNNLTGAGVNYGSGHVTQTGGVVQVDNGAGLYLAGYGNGDYTLAGGTLEIGGRSLYTRYNNTTSTYAFNLAGGTLKVSGSALVTDAVATAQTNQTSTIDTNGFDATFNNGFAGSGTVIKQGAGTLTLGGGSSFTGALTVSSGRLRVNGNAGSGNFTVNSGASFGGSGTVGNVSILSGGTLVLGATPSQLTITGDLRLASGSFTQLQLASLANYDRLSIGGTLFAGGALSFSAANGVDLRYATSFTIFNAQNFSGTFDSIQLPSLANGFNWDTSALYSTGRVSITAAAIPEPATWTALAGIAALVLVWSRRRRMNRGPARLF